MIRPMPESNQLANRIREVFIDGHWVAKTNYKDLLENLTLSDVTSSIGNHNNISLIVFHVNYYLEGLNNVFQGGELTMKDADSFEMPPLTTADQWNSLQQGFLRNANDFADIVESMNAEVLHSKFVREEYGSYLRNIEAVIEHAYYHLGQISILVKMMGKD